MMFSTIRLQTSTGYGTGFFFVFNYGDANAPVIVTNRHVVNGNERETVSFSLHLDGDDFRNLDLERIAYNTRWFFHPTQDLAICFAQPLFDQLKTQTGRNPFFVPLTEDLVANDNNLGKLTALEEVTMVGYPRGISDEAHGLPIFRKGYTASHPTIDFNGDPIGLMDIAGWWGSSGSPVFIFNPAGYTDRFGNTYLGQGRLLFLGVQYAIPVHNAEGNIVLKQTPTELESHPVSMTTLPMNLAYYVKAKELLWFKKLIGKILSGEAPD